MRDWARTDDAEQPLAVNLAGHDHEFRRRANVVEVPKPSCHICNHVEG